MGNLQETLQSFQPYVVGIRYMEGHCVVDTQFKEGWAVPESKLIKQIKSDVTPNYYMFFADSKDLGLDDILTYVKNVIKINQERELKQELLKKKIEELKTIFRSNPLAKLQTLRLTFNTEPEDILMDDIDENTPEPLSPLVAHVAGNGVVPESNEPFYNEYKETQVPVEMGSTDMNAVYVQPTPLAQDALSEEELEILEEERRAANFLSIRNPEKAKLLPQNAIQMVGGRCNCTDEEACPKCIDSK